MAITVQDDIYHELVDSIRRYFAEERDEEIGELQATFLLDFVLQEVGPSIYNQALRDVQVPLQTVVAELDTTLYEPEFAYTAKRRAARNRGHD